MKFFEQLRVLLTKRQRRQVALLTFGLMVAALLELAALLAVPAFVGLVSDPARFLGMIPGGVLADRLAAMNLERLTLLSAAGLALLYFLKNGYSAALIYAESVIQRDVRTTVATRLFRHYLHRPYTFHLQNNPARLYRNVMDETWKSFEYLHDVVKVLRESLVLAVIFVLLLVMDPVVSISVLLLVGGTAGVFYLFVRRRLSHAGEMAQAHRAVQIQALNQGLGAIIDAKIIGCEDHLLAAFERETASRERYELVPRVTRLLPRLLMEVVGIGAVLLVAAMFILLGRPIQSMLPVLALLAVAVVRLVPAMNTIAAAMSGMRYTQSGFDVVTRELATVEDDSPAEAPTLGAVPAPMRSGLTLRGVRYRYPDTPEDALHDVSLVIPAGQAVAFIGPSGAGKSTLVGLILGLLTPTSGEIRADGVDIRTDLAGWRRQIGYIPQDIYLIDDTIRRNIAFGVPDAEIDNAALMRAVRAARLERFIESLPDGLDTVVGNRGTRLSGGQRQRIGIARALYRDPSILVLDEATSALDNETEREVIEAIRALRDDHTIIMIAHRLTTVVDCDRLYLLDGGRVADSGTYLELGGRHEKLRIPTPAGAGARADVLHHIHNDENV